MKKILLSSLITAAALFATTPVQAATNLVTNGSFELGASDPGSFSTFGTGSTDITAWTVANGTVDYIGSYWQAADGVRSIDLAGSSYGTLSQSVSLVANQAYSLTFALSANPDNATFPRIVRVGVGGLTQDFAFTGTPTRSNMDWQLQTFNFVASTTGSTDVSFTALNADNFYGPALDNVSLSAVPEPTTWALMLTGFGLIGFSLRRRSKKAEQLQYA